VGDVTEASRRAAAELRWAALVALGTHALAGFVMLLVLRRGLASNPEIADRMAFVAEHAISWRAAWVSWSVAALSFLYLSVTLARAASSRDASAAAFSNVAPFVAAAAVAIDLSAETLAMFVLPDLARASDVAPFQLVERIVTVLSGGLANALYTIAFSLLAWTARGWLPRYASLAAVVVALSGATLTVSAAAGSAAGMVWSNAALLPALLVWLWGVAKSA
jgi:hypothetical protein